MKLSKKNTITLFRVFFVVLIIGVIGFIWNQVEHTKIPVKTTGGALREGIVGAPRFINPVLAQSQADRDLTRVLFTPLLTVGDNGEIDYKLAENVTISDDLLVYTLDLQKGLTFSDNMPVKSSDIIFTIESIQDPLIKSPQAVAWEGITVRSVDYNTVTFTLIRPFNDFLHNLEIGILPKHIWENINPQEFIFSTYNTEPIGIGPFTLKKIIEEKNGIPSEYQLNRSKNYFETTYIDHLVFKFFESENMLLDALKNNVIDSAYGISPEAVDLVPKSSTITSDSLPRYFALFLNQEKQKLFASEALREVLNKTINRDILVQNVFNGYAHALIGPDSNITAENNYYTKEAAENIIEKEGWKRNSEGVYAKLIDNEITELSFSITTSNVKEIQAIAESIQSQLSVIGIRVNIRSYDQGNLNQNIIRPRDYESLLFGYEIEKPSDLYAFWHSSQIDDPGLNISIFKQNKADVLLEKMRSEDGSRLIADFNNILSEHTPAIFLYKPSYIYVLPKEIQGVELFVQGSEDRFNSIGDWYIETRKVWPLFVHK
jgi:peptide/nickel transport system substrate-binding protein